jgi:hypothetical protein
VNCLQQNATEGHHKTSTSSSEESIAYKPAIEPECETKRVPLDPRILDRIVMIS